MKSVGRKKPQTLDIDCSIHHSRIKLFSPYYVIWNKFNYVSGTIISLTDTLTLHSHTFIIGNVITLLNYRTCSLGGKLLKQWQLIIKLEQSILMKSALLMSAKIYFMVKLWLYTEFCTLPSNLKPRFFLNNWRDKSPYGKQQR